jgi:protein YIPF6
LLPQLFADSVPSVPVSVASSNNSPAPSVSLTQVAITGFGAYDANTLDEPVLETLKRDVITIAKNLRSVLIPMNWDFNKQEAALHNWDLWGPLVRMACQHRNSSRTQLHLPSS